MLMEHLMVLTAGHCEACKVPIHWLKQAWMPGEVICRPGGGTQISGLQVMGWEPFSWGCLKFSLGSP